ncbi:putative bifunctional diguanylate cyclase/phosphodiesterase [Magnetospirillum sulfuroxidans]|uniref:EAL domain-containing protein n=1 Tax=Magnetospirillum sulfuroxidans TaxID=611300 RepID=A0ABS5I857_9PROT|nr:GGDEF domain-containing phosphodiesterase [Magnetospirillum sulfuroxidans]MBR9970441.1 EAL domain-containing protein [Magnetospirillum sulfuroxidans]
MDVAAPTVIFGAFLSNLVLAVALAFVGRGPALSRSFPIFATAFAFFALRFLFMALAWNTKTAQGFLWAELMHVGAATVLIAGVGPLTRQKRGLWMAVALGTVMTAWTVWAAFVLSPWTAIVPASAYICLAMMLAAWEFQSRARRSTDSGNWLVALLFVLWGLHKFFYLWLIVSEDLLGYSFALNQVLSISLGVVLLLVADRQVRANEGESRRRSQALLRLQAEAMAVTANAIFITDQLGRIEWCNQAFSQLTGWSEAEAMGRGARRLLLGVDRDARMDEALINGETWRGELNLRRRDGTLYVVDQTITPIRDDRGVVSHYVVVQEDVTERRRAEERIRFLSSNDSLTALPNRLLFREQIQRAIVRAKAERHGLAVLILDLDDFSHYNDVLGHDGGDHLLLAIVERLMTKARGVESTARVGGDEFGFLLQTVDGGETAAELAQTLVDAMRRPFDIGGHEVQVGAVVGVTLFPNDGDDADTLLKNANMAMYRAIQDNPNGYRFFAPTMDAELALRRRLENDLRRAIQREELELHYQPIVNTIDHRIIAFEALLRWRHASDGWISPVEFIPMAEGNGMIGPIGEWVLRRACQQMRDWDRQGIPPVPVAVNMSALQLKRHDVPLLVRKMLTEAGIPSHRLELELTETTVMEDADAAQRIFSDIAGLGVKLAVDDFGTGYSSLARLKRFPVGKLKIDRSFVGDLAEDEGDAAIARAIISMGHAMGLKVVAEGVETAEQLAILADAGCDAIQGFFFSRPVPADQAAELLRRGFC